MFVSRIQIIGPGENNFVKWKETFRSDRLDQIRSVSVKARIAKASQPEHERRPVGVNVFFSLDWESDSPTRDLFSSFKGN